MITSVVNSGVQSWVSLAVAVVMTIHIHAVVVQDQGITSKKRNMDKKMRVNVFIAQNSNFTYYDDGLLY